MKRMTITNVHKPSFHMRQKRKRKRKIYDKKCLIFIFSDYGNVRDSSSVNKEYL